MGYKILFVEDDPGLIMTLTDRLVSAGYEVSWTDDGAKAVGLISVNDYDCVLLDVMLKGKNGFDVCQSVRTRGATTPILMLTARGEVKDKVTGLKLGADDYVTKPFEIAELLARIEALIRRRNPAASFCAAIKIKKIEIDFNSLEVRREGKRVEMSAKEFQLLRYLFLHQGRALSREELLNEVWGYEESPTTRTIDTHIGWLRQKLEENPKEPDLIQTVHGFGYKLNSD